MISLFQLELHPPVLAQYQSQPLVLELLNGEFLFRCALLLFLDDLLNLLDFIFNSQQGLAIVLNYLLILNICLLQLVYFYCFPQQIELHLAELWKGIRLLVYHLVQAD